jgi:hypothetical protein
MRRGLLLRNLPLASPVALRHDRRSPLWQRAFWRITPGALSLPLSVLLFVLGGWS